jgi:hypothetical protein
MAAFVLGILGGILAWFATMLFGQPFYELVNLRRKTAEALHMYDPATHDDRATMDGWNAQRADAYRDCAAKLLAFYSTQLIVATIAERALRWRLKEAANQLWKLAPLGPSPERQQLRHNIAKAFNLKF